MCGIVGIVARNAHIAPQMLERATDSLAHRGPDDSGTVILRETVPEPVEIGLGSRRLAILDLSPLGHQPMKDEATGNWIVYNGETYNFREIRRELEGLSARFRGHSDTEVLLQAYGCWGEKFLSRLRGMFAFAIWDARRHRLLVARDPMGIKPLYYYSSPQHFLFASELRTLLGTDVIPRRLNPAGLASYLTFGSIYEPETIIQDIHVLRPGHYLVWENGDVKEFQYWDLPTSPASPPPGDVQLKQLQAEVHAALDESVRMQMVSDVPVGVFLSGGIDSSVLAGILRRGGSQVSTFSVVFDEHDYSEAEHSRAVASELGTDHHELVASQQDASAAIPGFLSALDQPTIDGLNTYIISQQTRAAGIKVALSGLGGDELFAGYSAFRAVPRMERFSRRWAHMPSPARHFVAEIYRLLVSDNDQNRKLASLIRANGDLLHPYFLTRTLFTPDQRAGLLTNFDNGKLRESEAPLRESLHRAASLDPINRVSYLESRCYMLNTLLRDSDVMSMAHGLEVRVPLIDHVLAEKVFALPGKSKLSDSTPKPLLVSALAGSLPAQVVHRPKRGFTLPFEHWLRGELRPEIENTLQRIGDSQLAEALNSASVQKVWANFLAGKTSWSRPWSLYVLSSWCEQNAVTA